MSMQEKVMSAIEKRKTTLSPPRSLTRTQPTPSLCMYAALMYAYGERTRRKQKWCFTTFDNGLFPKVVQIVASHLELTQKVVVRLGGFHSLMSFMGAIGYAKSSSGLDDLWDD
ncbi:hypothetical protein FOCC_FOCC013684, partial [Frankliniella occidentalis]